MRYLLDTDWAIQSLNGIEPFRFRIQELMPFGIAISVVSVGEIYEGIFGSYDSAQDEAALLDFLGDIEVLPLDIETARIFGRERDRLRSVGLPLEGMDPLIAATALRHDLILLTNNPRHFERFDALTVESL